MLHRDGNLTALHDLTDVVVEAFRLRSHGVEGRYRVSRGLDVVARQHLDSDSQTAIRLARAMLRNEDCFSNFCQCADALRPGHIAHELLVQLSIENCQFERIEFTLRTDPGRYRDRADHLRPAKRRAREILRASVAVREIAAGQILDAAPTAPEAAPQRPTIKHDQRSLTFSAFGSVREG